MAKKNSGKKKSIFNRLVSEIRKIRVEDVLFVIILITALLLVLSLLVGAPLLSAYFASKGAFKITDYFDLVVRNGSLRYLYFALVIALVYWVAKKTMKQKFNTKIKVIALVAGIVIAVVIYLLPPYYLRDTQVLPGEFSAYLLESDIFMTNHAGCDGRVDFIFSPSSDQAMKVMPEIQKLIEQGIRINLYCVGDSYINDNLLCKKKYGLDPAEGEKLRDELGINTKANYPQPQLIVDCQYWINDLYDANVTRQFICEHSNSC